MKREEVIECTKSNVEGARGMGRGLEGKCCGADAVRCSDRDRDRDC